MITLERVTDQDFPGEVWTDEANYHVIVQETPETFPVRLPGAGWYVRDYDGIELGPFASLDESLATARQVWGEVTLGPADRLARSMAEGRADEVGQFLLEYLADYGAVGIDVQALAQLVMTRQEG